MRFDRVWSTRGMTCLCWRRIRTRRRQSSGLRSTGSSRSASSATAAKLDTVAPPWLRDANLDPRLRVAAGLGGEVVRQNQDRYVEEAWRQVGDVLAANALRRRGEFSMAATRDAAPEVDLAAVGRRPRDLDGPRPRARVRQRRTSRSPGDFVSRRCRPRSSRSSIAGSRAPAAPGAGAAAWRAAVGPEALASRSAAVQPLKVAVALDTIDTIEAPSRVWGPDAAPAILETARAGSRSNRIDGGPGGDRSWIR